MRFISSRALLALATVLAVGAASAATASAALPELSPRGTVANPIAFTLKVGVTKLSTPEFETFTCEGSNTGTGSFTSAKSGTAKLTLHGCGSILAKCYSPGAEAGTIVTESVPFVLVYTEKEPTKQVAIDFNHKGETFVKYTCGSVNGDKWTVRHAILAPVTPINTLTKTFTAALTTSSKGAQTPTENYNEELTGMEKSFPEVALNEGGFRTGFGLTSSTTIENLKKSGVSIPEAKIEA